jgi:hypothetical protein
LIVTDVTFTLPDVVMNPMIVLVAVNALRGVTLSTADGALDARIIVLSVIVDASALLADFIMLPEVSTVAGFTD